jgi:HK97 family phage portal protein
MDPERPFSPALAQQLTLLLQNPNQKEEYWTNFIQPIVEDLLVLDAGVIEKEFTLRGQVCYLHSVDGGNVKVSRFWDGEDPGEARYFWYPDHVQRASFTNREMIYMMQNSATYRVVGLSPLETLKLTIDAELSGHSYNTRQVQNAAPDGMLDLGEAARPEQVDDFKRYWAAEVAGKGAMAFVGGSKNAKFIPFRTTNREMQLLEWQIYLVRKIAAVFGLSPMDLGMASDVNRSTADVQQDNTDDRGIRPILGTVQTHITREVVHDRGFGGPDNNLAFRFTALNLKESSGRAQINRYALAGVPWKSVNDARRGDGLPPLEGDQYEQLIANTSTGLVALDDIPTAREYLESKKPAPGEGKPPGGSDAKKPRKGMEELDGSIAVSA